MTAAIFSPFWSATLTSAGIMAIITLGLYVSNSAGALSVAHAALAGLGGYASGVLTKNFDLAFPLALCAAAIVGAIAGVVLAGLTLRMNPLVAGLTTLAFGETMVVIAYNIAYIGGAQTLYDLRPATTLGNVWIILGVLAFAVWRYERSRIGLAARACRDSTYAASANGITVPYVKIFAFALGAAIAGIGGGLRAHYILVQSPVDMGFTFSLTFVIFWVFGGSYTFLGSIVGALALTILPEALRFSNEQRFMVYSAILVAVVVLRPSGLIPRIPYGSQVWPWTRTKRPRTSVLAGQASDAAPEDASAKDGR